MSVTDSQSFHFALPKDIQVKQYTITETIGYDGFSIRYQAYDTTKKQDVILHELLPRGLVTRNQSDNSVELLDNTLDKQFKKTIKSWIKDAKLLMSFEHPAIETIIGAFQQNGTAYVVSEVLEGVSLDTLLAERKVLGQDELLSLLVPLLDALTVAHNRGLMHCDVQPRNIWVKDYFKPILINFANARYNLAYLTGQTGGLLTPHYAAYEQYELNQQLGLSADYYSLGATFYFTVTGIEPPDAFDRHKLVSESGDDPLVPVDQLSRHTYNESVYSSILWMLELDVDERPSHCNDVYEMLSVSTDISNYQDPDYVPAREAVHYKDPVPKPSPAFRKWPAALWTLTTSALLLSLPFLLKLYVLK